MESEVPFPLRGMELCYIGLAMISVPPFVVWSFHIKAVYGPLKMLAHFMAAGTPALEIRCSLLCMMMPICVFVYSSLLPGPSNFQVLS